MKRTKIAYWLTTGLTAFSMAAGGVGQMSRQPEMVVNMARIGYPAYFMVLIGAWKLAAAIAIVLPGLPRLKEWAYAGITFLLTGAFVSHLAGGDPIGEAIPPLFVLVIALASWALRPPSRKLASH